VDTHIFRVANRTGIAPAKTSSKSKQVDEIRPGGIPQGCHHWLILHGRLRMYRAQGRHVRLPDPRSLRIQGEEQV